MSGVAYSGKNGHVMCRVSTHQAFTHRFVHISESGDFLCISKQSSSCECLNEAESLSSCVWNQPFSQIQISCEEMDSISELSGVTPGVAPEYGFGLQGEGRVVSPSDRSGGSGSGGRVDSDLHLLAAEQTWSLVFTSEGERDEWKAVLVRGLEFRLRQHKQLQVEGEGSLVSPAGLPRALRMYE